MAKKTIDDLTVKQWAQFAERGTFPSNNWLKLHGFVMHHRGGRRKRMTDRDRYDVPFPEPSRKRKRWRA